MERAYRALPENEHGEIDAGTKGIALSNELDRNEESCIARSGNKYIIYYPDGGQYVVRMENGTPILKSAYRPARSEQKTLSEVLTLVETESRKTPFWLTYP